MSQPIFLTKEDGSKEEFDPNKLLGSLMRSGASESTANKIVAEIVGKLSETRAAGSHVPKKKGIIKIGSQAKGTETLTASRIYRNAFAELRKMSLSSAARYSLRRSLMEFGPTGFPFEEYVAEIFKARGYSTLTDQTVLGSCVPHEVDVVAWNERKLLMAEVKYHNDPSGKTDLKVALYVRARFEDLKETHFEYGAPDGTKGRKLDEGWLITNTKFTETALVYGKCSGLRMLSWNYPSQENLQDMIEETKLHPLTCLSTLTSSEKRLLLTKRVVLCKDLYNDRSILKKSGFSQAKIFKVMEEISSIMNTRP